ncbi:MAG TPA: glycosyltransferase family 39 protein [Elusimicrobiota bacterium]|nr:glycosyltransferase family 39 protein [Elusimicrobiota bacterium]
MGRADPGRKIPERILERQEVSPTALGLVIVLAFVAFAYIPFMGKAYHMDEPAFLAPAFHILRDPLHPLAFDINWYGRKVPQFKINNQPPLFPYLLALALKCTGGREFATRLFFLPFDWLAAASLFLLAGKFLKKPLWPTLVVLASPGYLIAFNLLYPDKVAAALGFFGLYAWTKGLDEKKSAWQSLALASLGLAIFSKYIAVVFLVPAAVYALWRRHPLKKTLAVGAALIPVGLYLSLNLLRGGSAFHSAWNTTRQGLSTGWAHRWRAALAFTGGLAATAALWPFLAFGPRKKTAAAAAAAAIFLFLPLWDHGAAPALLDRTLGTAMAFAAIYGLCVIFTAEDKPAGWELWAPWIAAVFIMESFVYWSVIARSVALLLPPLAFASASALEKRLGPKRLAGLYAASFAVILALSLSLAWVDDCYADAQRQAVRVARQLLPQGGRLWISGHWGLQYYAEQAGGRELDASRGGWDQVRPGDVVLWSQVNTNQLLPDRRFLIDAKQIDWKNPLPLRLMSGPGGEAGFYSSVYGFLPYSFSRAPLDEFFFAKILPQKRRR